uniref:F-box only protein 33 n=1 Tax=Panagrellus redivivus TaxID=6233 RepID=A0A7E4W4R3_PANRE
MASSRDAEEPPSSPTELLSPLASARQRILNATYNLMRFVFDTPLVGLNGDTFKVYQAINILKNPTDAECVQSALHSLKSMSDYVLDQFDDNPEMRALLTVLRNRDCVKSLRITSQSLCLDEYNVIHISHVKFLCYISVTEELTLQYLSEEQSNQVVRSGTQLRHSILVLEHSAITRDDFERLMHCEPSGLPDDVGEDVPLCQPILSTCRVMDLMLYGVTITPPIDLPFILKRLGCFDPCHSGSCSKKLIIGANSGGNFTFTPDFPYHLLDAMPEAPTRDFNHASRHHFTVMQLIGIEDYEFDKEAYKSFESRNEALSSGNIKPLIILVKKGKPPMARQCHQEPAMTQTCLE